MGSMHYRPMPRGYKVRPFIPPKVKVSTITDNIISGKYDVIVFYTDEARYYKASVVRKIEGKEAIPVAQKLLNEWANYEGKVEKCLLSTRKSDLHEDLRGYRNLYTKLNSSRHELIALIKK